jgi:hypothetical protein
MLSGMNLVLVGGLFQVLLTFIVCGTLFVRRITELQRRKINPQKISTSLQSSTVIEDLRASDNFKNLFEVPILFYFFCSIILITRTESYFLGAGSFLFVAIRALHSYVQCTGNKVMLRFYLFAFSTLTLMIMWIFLAFLIFS